MTAARWRTILMRRGEDITGPLGAVRAIVSRVDAAEPASLAAVATEPGALAEGDAVTWQGQAFNASKPRVGLCVQVCLLIPQA